MINKEHKENIIPEIERYSDNLLRNNLEFSAIFGSYAYNGITENDIDLIFVIKRELSSEEKEGLINGYLELHKTFNLKPDLKFPGEYVLTEELVNAEKGHGFEHSGNRVEIPLIRSGGDWNSFNDYRHHLTVIGGPTIFINGNLDKYTMHKKRCLKTLTKTILLYNQERRFSLKKLVNSFIGEGKHFLGFANEQSIKRYLSTNLDELLQEWLLSGEIDSEGIYYHINNPSFLERLEHNIKEYNNK